MKPSRSSLRSATAAAIRRLAATAGCLLAAGWPAFAAAAEIPEPDHTFYGTATRNAVLVREGLVTVRLNGDPAPVASYPLGSESAFGDRFVLRVPLAFGVPRQPGSVRAGDEARFFLDGELAAVATVGVPGGVTLLDLDPFFNDTPELSITAAIDVAEGDSGTRDALLTVLLSRPITSDVSVDYATADGTAVAPGDYAATSGRLTIAAGDTQSVLRVPVVGDLDPEPPEDFFVMLSDPRNAVLAGGAGRGVVTIGADDAQFVLRVADAGVLEADGAAVEAVFAVSVTSEAPGDFLTPLTLTVDYATADGTATAGSDYESTAGVLAIDTGTVCPELGVPCGVIRVPVYADNRDEPDETFFVRLSNPALAVLADGEATGTIFNDENFLLFVEAEIDGEAGAEGLGGALAAAVSPDGLHLYVAAGLDDALAVFGRDPATGELTPGAVVRDGDLGTVDGLAGVEAVAISPDGLHVYAAGFVDDAVAVFEREPVTGELTFVERRKNGVGGVTGLDGAISVAVAPDGLHVYAAGFHSDAVAVFERDPSTGTLTFAGAAADGLGGVDGLVGADAVAVSPDGQHVYVASSIDSTVVVLARDPGTGLLSFVELEKDAVAGVDGLDGASAVAIAPDGLHVYAAGGADAAVAVFARDAATGELSFVQRKKNGFGGISGLAGASAVAVSSDGELVYAAGETDSAVVVFRRDRATGVLEFVEARRDGDPDVRGPLDGLAGGSGLALGPEADGRHVYVAGHDDHGVAVFFKDTIAPDVPTLSSSSHPVGAWSTEATVALEWTARDNLDGVGLTGYSFLFDSAPGTLPDIELETLHDATGDPQRYRETLPDSAAFYFHLRACDAADNCSEPAEIGPFMIDGTPPSVPLAPTSPSHGAGVPSPLGDLTVTWTPSSDATSGVAGYAFVVDGTSGASCSRVRNLDPQETTLTVEGLPTGTWYFHVCAVDAAGNWSPPAVAGPFEIDVTSPRVAGVRTVAATDDGTLSGGDSVPTGFTQLLLGFNESMAAPAALTSYRLLEAGEDRRFLTAGCGPIVGDDVAVPIDFATADPAGDAAALHVGGGTALAAGSYRLTACSATLGDGVGNPLDGDGDGTAGGDFALDFRVTATNLLRNPNFDGGLDRWQSTSTADGDFVADFEDAGGADTSGSARWSGPLEDSVVGALSQCVELGGAEELVAGGRAFMASAAVTAPTVSLVVELFPTLQCQDDPTSTSSRTFLTGDSGGSWIALPEASIVSPADARSVLISYLVTSDTPSSGEVFLDDLYFYALSHLFSDGFESGDVTAWSSAVP